MPQKKKTAEEKLAKKKARRLVFLAENPERAAELREKRLKYMAIYNKRPENKAKANAWGKAKRAKDPEAAREAQRQTKAKKKDRYRRLIKEWQAKHPALVKQYKKNYVANNRESYESPVERVV